MKTLPGDPSLFPDVCLSEPGVDPWGSQVIDGPMQALTDRTEYLKTILHQPIQARYYWYVGDVPVSPGDVICGSAWPDDRVYRADVFGLIESGGVLGIALQGLPGDGRLLVATGGVVDYWEGEKQVRSVAEG